MKMPGSGLCSFIMQKELSEWIDTGAIALDQDTRDQISKFVL